LEGVIAQVPGNGLDLETGLGGFSGPILGIKNPKIGLRNTWYWG